MTGAHPVRDSTLPDLFEARVRATPEAIALVDDEGVVSYRALNAQANRLAHLLIALGAGPERVVGVALPRSVGSIVAMVAVLKSGAVYLPLNPAYPRERTALVVADAKPVALLTNAEISPSLPELPATLRLLWDDLDTGRYPETGPVDADRTRPLRSAHPLYLIYTSGSTGAPKGVLMPATSLVNLLAWHAENFPVGPGTRTAHLSAIGFDFSIHEVLSTLVHGRSLVVPAEEVRLDPVQLARWLDRHRVNQLFLPNVLIESLCDAAEVAGVGLDSLTDIVQSGEVLVLDERVRRFMRRHPRLRVRNHYGSTEMQDVTAWSTGAQPIRLPPTIGRPLWNTRVYVLDERLRAVPAGTAGELYVAGAGLARGYLNQPGLTAERFLPDPFGEPGERMYRTGDLGRWNDAGELEHLGRSDNQVKVHGFRVELGEVEARLRALPDVAKAVVLPRALHAASAPASTQLVAYVVPAAGARPEACALRDELARVLPAHMVPATVVPLAELPLGPNGKIDLRALPMPAMAASTVQAGTPKQRALANVFAEVLGVSSVGADDDFFQLGGDSITAIQLIIRARRRGLAISTNDVFELGSPRRLATVAADVGGNGGRRTAGPLIALRREQLARLQATHPGIERLLPATPLQQGFLFHRLRDEQGFDVYAEQVVLSLAGHLDADALRSAGRALLARHEALRAGFFVDGLPHPVQLIVPEADVPWEEIDLSALGSVEAAQQARRLTERHRRARFNLQSPPMVRFQLIRLSHDEHRLAVAYHHILLDGWSVSLLVRDLFALYRAPGGLPATAPYHEWLRGLLARDREAAARAWRGALGDVSSPVLLAPAGADQPAPPSARHVVDLSPAATERLNAFGRQNRLTVNTVVQAMWGILLGAATGGRDAVFGITVSGREPETAGVEEMVGLLINTVPVVVRLRPDETALSLLRRLQGEQQRLAPHKHLGLGAIQRLLGWSTEFDTLLAFENPALQLTAMLNTSEELRITGVEFSDDTFYTVSIVATPGRRLRLSLTYRPDLLDQEGIRRLGDGLAGLLSSVAGDPRRLVGALVDAAGARLSKPVSQPSGLI